MASTQCGLLYRQGLAHENRQLCLFPVLKQCLSYLWKSAKDFARADHRVKFFSFWHWFYIAVFPKYGHAAFELSDGFATLTVQEVQEHHASLNRLPHGVGGKNPAAARQRVLIPVLLAKSVHECGQRAHVETMQTFPLLKYPVVFITFKEWPLVKFDGPIQICQILREIAGAESM